LAEIKDGTKILIDDLLHFSQNINKCSKLRNIERYVSILKYDINQCTENELKEVSGLLSKKINLSENEIFRLFINVKETVSILTLAIAVKQNLLKLDGKK